MSLMHTTEGTEIQPDVTVDKENTESKLKDTECFWANTLAWYFFYSF